MAKTTAIRQRDPNQLPQKTGGFKQRDPTLIYGLFHCRTAAATQLQQKLTKHALQAEQAMQSLSAALTLLCYLSLRIKSPNKASPPINEKNAE